MVHMTPLCDRNVAGENAIMNVEEGLGGVGVGESAVPGPSESRDESEIDRRRCVPLHIHEHSLARGMLRMRSPDGPCRHTLRASILAYMQQFHWSFVCLCCL